MQSKSKTQKMHFIDFFSAQLFHINDPASGRFACCNADEHKKTQTALSILAEQLTRHYMCQCVTYENKESTDRDFLNDWV